MTHGKRLLSCLFSTAVICALLPLPAGADLFDYVNKPDDAFTWELRETIDNPMGKIHDLHMVSQVWQGITWEHQIQVYEPREVKYPQILPLLITGGSPGFEEQTMGLMAANMVGARIAVLFQIPNQPLFDDLNEDALISYTWVKYMETGDEDWILNFPMVKATIRAMDCLAEVAKSEWGAEVEGFVPFGASKRGWTTYLTGIAVPERCLGIAPMVFDILNMPIQIQHQWEFWGDYSPMISEYTDKGIQDMTDTGRGFRLSWIVDPYTYRDKLTMPKLVVLGSNDPYWPVDAVNQYYPGLPGPKLLLIAPNSGHGLDDTGRLIGSVASFFKLLAGDKPLPQPKWQWDESPEGAKLTVSADPKPDETRIWVARMDVRDFRQATWAEEPLPADGDGFAGDVARADGQYTAAYGELVFMVDGLRLTVSTQPYVLHPK